MIINELIRDMIRESKIDLSEQRRVEIMNRNFEESLKRFKLKEEISMKDMATVDRIESNYVVCELLNGEMTDIPLKLFKEKVSEGDIFDIEVKNQNGQQVISVGEKNEAEMKLRRKIILEKLNKIKNK